jgi:hypothetical protein
MTSTEKTLFFKFVKFAKAELGITLPFKLKLSDNRDGFKTYAYYDPANKLIAVYTKNRALGDCMRSFCHELVHHKQHQNGEIKPNEPVQDVGGKIENDANSIAGVVMKKFGYSNPNLDIWNCERQD